VCIGRLRFDRRFVHQPFTGEVRRRRHRASSVHRSGGATATVAVSTQAECTWSASTEANWITGLTPASGQGTGEVKVNVAPNPAATARQGDVIVNGVRAQIRQEAAPCRFELSASDQSFAASGGTARINVTTIAGCAWTARGDAPWVTGDIRSHGHRAWHDHHRRRHQ
jgi:hypothetical protein